MFVMGYGITLDVENLTFAVPDRDKISTSRDYTLNLGGSRYYFVEPAPSSDCANLDWRNLVAIGAGGDSAVFTNALRCSHAA